MLNLCTKGNQNGGIIHTDRTTFREDIYIVKLKTIQIMKQITVLLIALAVIMLPVACCLNSHDFEVDGIYYNKNGDGTVSVTSKGSSFNEYIDEYTGIVVIPSTVTYSGTTFSVTSIGDWAFSGCKRLTTICIPISVKTIGNFAFYGCTGLTSV